MANRTNAELMTYDEWIAEGNDPLSDKGLAIARNIDRIRAMSTAKRVALLEVFERNAAHDPEWRAIADMLRLFLRLAH